MGSYFEKLSNFFKGIKVINLILFGLDSGGKTTILYQLKLNKCVTTIPTIGFNLEAVKLQNLNINIFDLGGGERFQRLWGHFIKKSTGIIYVVDSNDKERIKENVIELQRILNLPESTNFPVLIMANKQDILTSFSPEDIAHFFEIGELKRRKWKVQGTCGITGQGIREGFEWIAKEAKEEIKHNKRFTY